MKKALTRVLAILIVAVLITAGFAFFAVQTGAVDYSIIRVKLSIGTPASINFKLSGNYSIEGSPAINLTTGSYAVKLESGSLKLYSGSTVLVAASGIKIVERTPPSGQKNYATITNTKYGTHNYLGNIQFISSSGSISVINHVYLEYYLYGVVPHEMSNTWPLEALKAQAVAARTYAVRYISSSGTYDVVDTSANQVYKGYSSSYNNAIAAVDATAKTVLKCNGQLVQTYFAASNGGYTDIPQHVWSTSTPLQPYHVIQADPFDTQNTWSEQEVLIFPKTVSNSSRIEYRTMSNGSMVQGTGSQSANVALYFALSALPTVASKGYAAAVSSDIEIIGIDSIKAHTYEGQHGAKDYNGNNNCVAYQKADVTMRVYATRAATAQELSDTGVATVREPVTVTFTIDLHTLDDTDGLYCGFTNASLRLFVVTETESSWNIYHRRYGHGVGLSQRGAQTRAKSGQTYQQILSFYYPSTTLEALNISPPSPQAPPVSSGNATIINCVSNVNVRSTPDTTYAAIGKAFLGDRITVTQPYVNATWHKIDFGGVEAYIFATYVKLDELTPTATSAATPTMTPAATPAPTPLVTPTVTPTVAPVVTPTATPTAAPTAALTVTPTVTPTAAPAQAVIATGTVSSSTLNVRSGPGTSYTKLGTLVKGATISIIQKGTSSSWHKIWYNNREGYVYTSYVKVASAPAIAASGTVNASSLNVRSGPGSSYSKLGTLAKGAAVSIIQKGASGGWHKIWYNNREAYVFADYTKLTSTPAVETAGIVTASTLNVRSGPGTSHTKVGTLAKGASVQVLKSFYSGSWHKIIYNGAEAYVHADYINLSDSSSTPTSGTGSTAYATINANLLNLRSAASMSGTVITTLSRNTVVQVLAQGEAWVKVKYAGSQGYVYASYLSKSNHTYGTVTCRTLNVRSGASDSSSILGKLATGDIVQIVEKGASWHKILYQSTTAYVYAAYIAF